MRVKSYKPGLVRSPLSALSVGTNSPPCPSQVNLELTPEWSHLRHLRGSWRTSLRCLGFQARETQWESLTVELFRAWKLPAPVINARTQLIPQGTAGTHVQKSGRGNLRKDSRVSKMCFARGTTAGTGGQCIIQGRSGTSSLVATKHYRAVCSDLGWRGNPVKTHTEDHDHAGDLRTMDVVGKFTFCTDNNPGYQHQYWVYQS